MKKIIIIGAGGHAKVIADIILKRKKLLNDDIELVGFLDDNFKNLNYNNILDFPILGDTSLIENFKEKDYFFVIGIGNNLIRNKLGKKYSNLNYTILIHPSAIIGNGVKIGEGTTVMANAVINSGTIIGKHCIINSGAIVEHDNLIENFVHISVGAKLAGTVRIEKNTWIGIGAVVNNNLSICENSMIGAGGVVVKDITETGIYVGVPAKMNGGGVVNLRYLLYLDRKTIPFVDKRYIA